MPEQRRSGAYILLRWWPPPHLSVLVLILAPFLLLPFVKSEPAAILLLLLLPVLLLKPLGRGEVALQDRPSVSGRSSGAWQRRPHGAAWQWRTHGPPARDQRRRAVERPKRSLNSTERPHRSHAWPPHAQPCLGPWDVPAAVERSEATGTMPEGGS